MEKAQRFLTEEEQRTAVVRGYLKEVLTKLRAVYARRLKAFREEFPGHGLPCETCAFRTSTDTWVGFDKTVLNLVAALEQGSPFWCHHGFTIKNGKYVLPRKGRGKGATIDYDRMQLCVGWSVLAAVTPDELDEIMPAAFRQGAVAIAREDDRGE